MTQQTGKLFVLPIDGSTNALKSLDYIGLFFGGKQQIDIHLLYVIPALPPILVEESRHNCETAVMLQKMEDEYISLAKTALTEGRQRLQELGFDPDRITTTLHAQAMGVAKDIYRWAEKKSADAIVMCPRGRGRLHSFIMGATATKVVDASTLCPVWIVTGKVTEQGVLIAVDRSEEAMRAVDHAGFILSSVNHPVTLFYSQRNLTSFVPRQVADSAPGLEQLWQDRVGKAIAPVMEKARSMLINAGVAESRITVRAAEGTRSAAADIIKTARQLQCGTIILGRRGSSGQSLFRMGSVSRNVMDGCENTAVWIVP